MRSGILRLSIMALAFAFGIETHTVPQVFAASASPAALSFQALQGGASPASQSVTVSKPNKKTTNWTASDSASWVSVSPASGSITNSSQITVSVNTVGLAAGTYSATIAVTMYQGGSVSIPVSLTVAPSTTSNSSGTSTPTTTTTTTTPTTTTSSGTTTSTTNTSSGTTTTPTAALPQITNLTNNTASGLTVTCANQPASIRYQTDLSSTILAVACNPTYSLVRTWKSGETFICVYARNAAGVENTVDYRCLPAPTTPTTGTSTTASLSWSAPTNSTGVAGYNVYVGTAPGVYGPPTNVGNVTSYAVNNLVIGNTYYFAVTDYNSSGVESPPSNEVYKVVY